MFLNILINLVLVTLMGQFELDYGQDWALLGKTEILQVSSFEGQLPEAADKPKGPIKVSNPAVEPELTARSAVVVDADTGVILFNKNAEEGAPMASLTKLMTTLVFLDSNPDWEKTMTIEKEDERGGAVLLLKRQEKLRLKDLFYATLVASTNNSVMTLVRSTGMTEEDFVKSMNQKAESLGLYDTHFIEPTGLEPMNVSTALDIVRLAWQAFKIDEIREAVTTSEYVFRTVNTLSRHRVKNTNELVRTSENISYTIIGGKTGYTEEAGFCLVVEARNKNGQRVIAAVLGSENNEARFEEVDKLITWVFESYQWL